MAGPLKSPGRWLLVAALLAYLGSGFYQVAADESAVAFRFGRASGGEFVALLNEPGTDGAFKLLERLQERWEKRPSTMPHTFSGGISTVDDRGWRPAIQAADRALRRCQETGNHWESAQAEDYEA